MAKVLAFKPIREVPVRASEAQVLQMRIKALEARVREIEADLQARAGQHEQAILTLLDRIEALEARTK